MLRNQLNCKYLLKHINNQQRSIHQIHAVLYNKNTSNVLRQGRIMGKLFGNRVTGSKKRWFPTTGVSHRTDIVFKESQFGKPPNTGGKNATVRMTVLNKLFMKHITDLMATGEISDIILGKGLQISRVKISQDFANVNVYWITTGEAEKDTLLEYELQRCSGLLRHELSQLGLMGIVPRIKFVKDKLLTNIAQVEALLKNMDFGVEENCADEIGEYPKRATDIVRKEFYYSRELQATSCLTNKEATLQDPTKEDVPADIKKLPEMRHDVLGLDHKGIMLKLIIKMRKSKQAWEQHQQSSIERTNGGKEQYLYPVCRDDCTAQTTPNVKKLSQKLAHSAENSQKFDAYLAKRKEHKNTPERKKYRAADHSFDMAASDREDQDVILSNRQRHLYEAEDYLPEDDSDGKP